MWATLIRVVVPSCPWAAVTRGAEGGALVRVLAHVPCGAGDAWEEAELWGEAWPVLLRRLRETPGASGVLVLESTRERARVRAKVPAGPLRHAVEASGILPRFPLEAHDGACQWLLVGERERGAAFVEALRRRGAQADVLSSREHRDPPAMTARQRDLLDAAVAQGYFEVPRRVTLTELARRMGVAKSTLSETLARAERHALEALAGGRGPPSRPPRLP